jgi:hypothetical protein
MSATNIPSACRIANIALNNAMILPYDTNSGRTNFSIAVVVRTSRMASKQAGKELIFILVQQSSGECRLLRLATERALPAFEGKDGAARLAGIIRHAHPRQE